MAAMTDTTVDAKVKTFILEWLKVNGPSRMKIMYDSVGHAIGDQLSTALPAMHVAGEVDRDIDGRHKGRPVYLWALPGQIKRRRKPIVSYRGEETLAAFQAAARERYGVQLTYIDRLKLTKEMELLA